MTTTPRELTDVTAGATSAEATYAVLDAALDAARETDAPFPEWRVRTLRTVRSRVSVACGTDGPRTLEPDHVATTLDVCHAVTPTPHERMAHEAEHEESHPHQVFGEVGVALRPFIGGAIPEPSSDP